MQITYCPCDFFFKLLYLICLGTTERQVVSTIKVITENSYSYVSKYELITENIYILCFKVCLCSKYVSYVLKYVLITENTTKSMQWLLVNYPFTRRIYSNYRERL